MAPPSLGRPADRGSRRPADRGSPLKKKLADRGSRRPADRGSPSKKKFGRQGLALAGRQGLTLKKKIWPTGARVGRPTGAHPKKKKFGRQGLTLKKKKLADRGSRRPADADAPCRPMADGTRPFYPGPLNLTMICSTQYS